MDVALQLAQEANALENDGQPMEAMSKWRRAFKLSPRLEHHYNEGGDLLEYAIMTCERSPGWRRNLMTMQQCLQSFCPLHDE